MQLHMKFLETSTEIPGDSEKSETSNHNSLEKLPHLIPLMEAFFPHQQSIFAASTK
jgi:hypothetical protein